MMQDTEKLYLFNPFDIKKWSDEMIEDQVRSLIPRYNGSDDTMYGMAKNIEILANINYLFGEKIARLSKEFSLKKIDCDTKEAKQITIERKSWLKENPGEKAPAMSFFEAKAAEYVREDRDIQATKQADLTRFKNAYESYEQIANAIKKKMDAVKYEEFNK